MAEVVRSAGRFAVVGATATAVHVSVFVVLVRGAGLGPTPATVPAFLCALAVSYTLNHRWTFGLRGGHHRFFARYALISGCGAVLNAGLMHVLADVLGLSYWYGLAAVLLVVPASTFAASRWWGFR